MQLPINEKEFEEILDLMRLNGNSSLYQKLLMFKNNNLYQKTRESNNGFS